MKNKIMDRKYYVCSVGEPGEGYDDENLIWCILEKRYVLNEGAKEKDLINKIEKNDLLILKYKGNLIGYGKAKSSFDTSIDFGNGWNLSVAVERWIIGDKTSISGIKDNTIKGSNYAAVREVKGVFALEKMKEIGLIL